MDKMLGLENGDAIAPSSLMYYVNVFDIDRLSTMESYIACTSEKIFQEKPQLYDLYVNNRDISFASPEIRNTLLATPVDESRYALLTEPMYAEQEGSEFNLTRFFSHLNQVRGASAEHETPSNHPFDGGSRTCKAQTAAD